MSHASRTEAWRVPVTAVIVVGAAAVVFALVRTLQTGLAHPVGDLLIAVATVAASYAPVFEFQRGDQRLTGDARDAVFVAALLTVGPRAVALPLVVGTIGASLAFPPFRAPLTRRVFSAAMFCASYVGGSRLLEAAGATASPTGRAIVADVVVVLLLGATQAAVVGSVVALAERQPVRSALRLLSSPTLPLCTLGVGIIGACVGALLDGPPAEKATAVVGALLLLTTARRLHAASRSDGRSTALLDIAMAFEHVREEDLQTFVSENARRFVRRPVAYRESPPSANEVGVGVRGGGWLVTAGRPPLEAADRQALEAVASLAAVALDRKRLISELDRRSRTDPLTGLANRRAIGEALEAALARALRAGTSVGVLLIDLDGFKQLNDSRGHAAGDEALVSVARMLDAQTRAGETAGRLGGDEFVLVVPEVTRARLEDLAERLGGRFNDMVAAESAFLGASIGVALSPSDGKDVATLLHAADVAMFDSKRQRKRITGRGPRQAEMVTAAGNRARREPPPIAAPAAPTT